MSVGGPIIGLIGSIIGGIGTAMMEAARMRHEAKMQEDKEKRAEARYEGVGKAGAFWDNIETSMTAQDVVPDPHKDPNTPLGQLEKKNMMGDKYAAGGDTKSATGTTSSASATTPGWTNPANRREAYNAWKNKVWNKGTA